MKKNGLGLFVLALLLFNVSCSSKANDKETNENAIMEVSLPIGIINANNISSDSTHSIILKGIMGKMMKHDKIQNPILNFEYDDKWIVSYKIKADKTFDIYVVEKQTTNDARAKMLITTKKEDPTSLISVVMIAYDNYMDKPGKIETEEWEATIKDDLSLKIIKTYNVITSVDKADYIDVADLSTNKTKLNEVEEIYQIDDEGNIVFIENIIFSKPELVQPVLNYRAFLAFKISDYDFEDINDEWMLNIAELEIACKRVNIIFIENYQDLSSVVIRDSEGNKKDSLDLSSFSQNVSMGYVLLHSKKKPEFVPFQPVSLVFKSISDYFNIEILDKNE
ncbi:MAG: hypothetical protein RBS19_09975 [Bacteroidales bacterium]|nr:hypothetical protein [Bacteroidales bacterium]MDY0217270.1 hypothetical protein [Bacteroidales bacterium]